MKRLAWALALAAPAAVSAAPAAPGPLVTVSAFLAAFNRGDIAAAKATHEAGDVTIVDEVPPHIWQGKGAFDAWVVSLAAFDKAHGRAGGSVTPIAPPRVATVSGDRAYVVLPVVYAFTEQGKGMREPATMTYALHRGAGGWKITSWSWNGTVPRRTGK